jgi:hypothetical protein
MSFDVLERARDQLVMLRARRRDREATVAGHDRGDAVVTRRRQARIPEDLRGRSACGWSMKPGATICPDASITLSPLRLVPISVMRPSVMATFGSPAWIAGAVHECAALDDHICAHSEPPCCPGAAIAPDARTNPIN